MDITTELQVCVDCAIVAANGDTSGIEDELRAAEVVAAVNALGHGFLIGDPSGFSWRWCDCCDSPLGGDRFDAVILG